MIRQLTLSIVIEYFREQKIYNIVFESINFRSGNISLYCLVSRPADLQDSGLSERFIIPVFPRSFDL